MPKVSVAIPVYNGAAHIERALASVEKQTFRDYEILVVDDGSTDRTVEILDRIPWVRLYRQPHQGVGAARRKLVEESRGQWIAFLDHDDALEPRMLERLLAEADDPKVVLVHGAKRIVDPKGGATEVVWRPRGTVTVIDHLLPDNQVSNGCVLVNARAARHGAFESDLQRAEDWLAWFRLAAKGPFRYVPEVVATIHKNSASLSQANLDWYQAEWRVLREFVQPNLHEWFDWLPRSELWQYEKMITRKLAVIASLIGAAHDQNGDRGEAEWWHRFALRYGPTKGAWLRYFRHLS